MKLLFIGFIFFLINFGCTKTNREQIFNIKKFGEVKADGGGTNGPSCGPGNSANSWDSVGIYHNLALDYVESLIDTDWHSITPSQAVDYVNEYITSTFGSGADTLLLSYSQVGNILADSSNFYDNIIDACNASSNVKTYYRKIISTLKDTSASNCFDYCNYIKTKMTDLEDTVINNLSDPELSTTEKSQILRVSSIARYSAYHWNKFYLLTVSGGEPIGTLKRKWWQWLVIGIADVAGGIVGATTGSPTGIGAVAGAVAGGAAASGSAAALFY